MGFDSVGTGKTYTTITLWEDATDGALTEKMTGEIQTNENFNERVYMGTPTGETGSIYRHLTVASANRHPGYEPVSPNYARMFVTGSGVPTDHAIDIHDQYFVLSWLHIKLNGSQASSAECVRLGTWCDPVLISHCLLNQSRVSPASYCDGVYAGDYYAKAYIDNCIIWDFSRAGIHAQNYGGTEDHDWFIDYCTVMRCNYDDYTRGANIRSEEHTGDFNNIQVRNVSSMIPQNGACFEDSNGGQAVWTGKNVIASDTSAESRFTTSYDSVNLVEVEPSANENFWVKDDDSPYDYRLDGENAYTKSQEGSLETEPANSVWGDNPQDFSVDVAGRSRAGSPSAYSIGAYQFQLAAVDNFPRHLRAQTVPHVKTRFWPGMNF